MTEVLVHTQPACMPCRAVLRYLAKHDIPHRAVPITPESAARFRALGVMESPVVELPGEKPFGGYRVTLLDAWRVKNADGVA